MSQIVAQNLGKAYGAYDVFTGLNFAIAKNDKIAIVGPNGCGKSTLLRILAGTDEASAGTVTVARGVTSGYLAQSAEEASDATIWEHVQAGYVHLQAMAVRLHALEANLEDDATLEKYGVLQAEFDRLGGYEMDNKTRRVLQGLGFSRDDEARRLTQLSGGQRVRTALARLLLLAPDVLLLDEPTNHLDAQGIEWLEGYLRDWPGTLVVVSHDRYFMDEVCERIWEMALADANAGTVQLETYRGNYTDYVRQRTANRIRAAEVFERQQAFVEKEQEYIRRNLAGQNTNQAKGRRTRLNRMDKLDKPLEAQRMALKINSGSRSGNIVLETNKLRVGYPKHALFNAPDLQLLRTERAALIGANGTGKSTFLKTVVGSLEPLAGSVKLGANVRIGYFAQAHEGLNLDNNVLDELMSASPDLTLPGARSLLGRFLFSGDDIFNKIASLSGGERGRVALAKLTLQGANLLLLDEPTNHLDIPSQEILTDALNAFDGTLLLVSHDRYLVAALAEQIWSLTRDEAGVTSFELFRGGYDEWRDAKEAAADALAAAAIANAAASAAPATKPATASNGLSKNQVIKRARDIEKGEARIGELEAKLATLGSAMQGAASDFVKLKQLGKDYAEVEEQLAQAWAVVLAL